ncbi:MAG: MATE family efflux transporter [Candidatus Omnitrophica bacterium]|nr:MATE family efflux transporter [Candidatus Omnitrophota bacterium]
MIRHFLKKRDLTQGNILVNIAYLAFPLMLSYTLHTTQSIIDMFWVGRLGSVAIAAVAMSTTVVMVLVTLIFGISTGTVALVSQNIGARQNKQADVVALQSIILSLISSVIIAIIGFLVAERLFQILGAQPEVISVGTGYLRILLLGGAAMFILFVGNALLQGSGDVVIPMIAIIIANVLNIILDPIFIFGIGVPRMGTKGAALASVISQIIACVFILRVLCKGHSHVHIRLKEFRLKLKVMFQILKIGIPSSLQMFFRTLMALVIMSIVASFGTNAVAAYGIGMRLQMVCLMPAFALGATAATLVGQNLGAGKISQARKSALVATGLDLIIMISIGIVLFTFAPKIISIFDKNKEVILIGSRYLRITALFYSFIAFSVVLNRALGGAGDTLVPMLITFVSLWLVQIPLAFILPRFFGLGLNGVWWAVAIAFTVNGLLTLIWFQIGHWKKRKRATA